MSNSIIHYLAKTISRCAFLSLTVSGMTLAQWYKQDVPTTKDLFDVHFVNPDVGWAVGMDGIILHTTNGGTSWSLQDAGDTTHWLHGVFGLDENTCLAVGSDTMIVKTTDGGATWNRVIINVPFYRPWHPRSILFIGNDTGWIAGGYLFIPPEDSSFVLRTVDGGMTWTKHHRPPSTNFPYKIDAIDGSHAWISYLRYLQRTTNGIEWEVMHVVPTNASINDFDFATWENGWMVINSMGSADLFHTTDSGKTWTHQWSPCGGVGYISFLDSLHGWFANNSCATGAIEVWYTSNGGTNWISQLENPISSDFRSPNRMRFVDSLNGWIVGTRGMIYHTTNGGVTSVGDFNDPLPKEFSMAQNYPNPFNPLTTITYELPNASVVVLRVYNLLGEEVRTLVNEIKPAGYHSVNFDGGNLPGGVYFYRLQSGNFSATRKLVLIK